MQILFKNKQAYFDYTIIDSIIGGIELLGTEVKSIKAGKVNMGGSYCRITNGEIFIDNLHISEHKQGGIHYNHEPLRKRKVLLHKREINKLGDEVKQRGLTLIPLELILTQTGLIKIKIGLAKGKKNYDKKEVIKLRDLKREENNI